MNLRRGKRLLAGAGIVTAVALALSLGLSVVNAAPVPRAAVPSSLAHVPAGSLLDVTELDSQGTVQRHFLLDPNNKRCLSETTLPGGMGTNIMVFDDTGHTSISGVTLEVYEASADYSYVSRLTESAAGMTGAVQGDLSVDGVPVQSITVRRDVEGEAVTGMLSVDSSGLVVREEWGAGAGRLSIERKLVPSSDADADALMRRSSLKGLAETMRNDRLSTLAQLSWEVLALPPGVEGLQLMWVSVANNWDFVELAYGEATDPGTPAVLIDLYNLSAYPAYPQDLRAAKGSARVETNALFDRACFAQRSVGIQVQCLTAAVSVSSVTLAEELVPIGSIGF